MLFGAVLGTQAAGVPAGRSYSLAAMPIYEYRCKKGHEFEVMQRFSDGPVTVCEVCGAECSRVFRAPAVHFKGSGFYNTDYGTRNRSREKEAASASEKSEAKTSSDSKSSSDSASKSDSKSSDSKPAAKESSKTGG
jgi:putative FmdB family regulatory protein